MQIIKWVILFLFLGILTPDSCSAGKAEEIHILSTDNATMLSNRTDHMFHALVAMVCNNAGELTEEISHTTLDKKAFIRLFLFLRYSHVPFPDSSRPQALPLISSRGDKKPAAYYIYTLERILV